MKTCGLSDNLSQTEQGKVSKAACVALWVGLGFFTSPWLKNEAVLFLHPDTFQHAKTATGPIFEVQMMWIDAY